MQDASGVQSFKYGKMGELIENIHTFVMPRLCASDSCTESIAYHLNKID